MSYVIARIAAEADRDPESGRVEANSRSQQEQDPTRRKPPRRVELPRENATGGQELRAHQFPSVPVEMPGAAEFVPPESSPGGLPTEESTYEDPERKAYRRRTVAMLRRYMKYS